MVTGTDLREMRLQKGLTTQQAAALIGISQPTLWNWESKGISRGRSADAQRLYKKLSTLPDDPKAFRTFDYRKAKRVSRTVRKVIVHRPNGREIAELRAAYGYTQEILGDMIGISPQELSHIERGIRQAEPDVIDNVCEVFGIPLDESKEETKVRTGSGARF